MLRRASPTYACPSCQTCVPCMARIQPGESPGARLVEPKASQRASASPRGGVQRKPKAKSQGDEQKPDMRRDAFGTSGHVTAKSSIYSVGGNTNKGAFCKSGVYARKDSCLTTGDLPCVLAAKAVVTESRGTGSDRMAEVSKRHSRCDPHRRPEP